jgi:Papain family cysteine protease
MKKYVLSALAIASIATSCRKDDVEKVVQELKGTGLILNDKDDLAKVKQVDFNNALFDFPSEFVLNTPPIVNQEDTQKCVAFSMAYMIVGFYNGLNANTPVLQRQALAGSPEYAFATIKKLNNEPCKEGTYFFDRYENNKMIARGMSSILQNYGTTSWEAMPFKNSNVCTVTNSSQDAAAKNNAIDGFYRMDRQEYTNTDELKNLIYTGHPITFAADTGSAAFKALNKNNTKWAYGFGGGGSHAMTIVGWSDAKQAFKVANSWGTDWCDNGYLWIDYNHMKTLLNLSNTALVLFPNQRQKAIFNKLTPASCGNNNWGYLEVKNTSDLELKIEIDGPAYQEKDLPEIDADSEETYMGIKTGAVLVKVINPSDNKLISSKNITITQCESSSITLDAQGKIN